jgi:colanic acid/amylovoran biosynthesis glycosyltransferase
MSPKLKLLVYSDIFGGNTTTFIYNEVLALTEQYDVTYVCIERQNLKSFPPDQLYVVDYRVNKILKKIRWWLEIWGIALFFRNRSYARGINQIVAEKKPDLIHCHFGYEALRFFDNLDQRNRRIPMLISFRGYDASLHLGRASYVKKIAALLAKSNVYTTFVCDFLRQNLLKRGIEVPRFIVLHSGTKLDLFAPRPAKKKTEIRFIQISSFGYYKGHKYTVAAFKQFLEKNPGIKARLQFTGEGPTLEETRKQVEIAGLEHLIDFLGWVDHRRAMELLSESDYFVQHSITDEFGSTEGIPNSIMEAMAMELPILSTWHAGIPELVEEGVNGYLVAEGDVSAFAEKMAELCKWPNRLPENREKIKRKFEFSVHMQTLTNFYRYILQETENK